MTRIIALANQKGGVGKTTTTLNLGAALANQGHRVLLIDLDPQSNLTTALGLNPYQLERTAYDVLHNAERGAEIAIQQVRELLHLLPSTLDMAAAEIELSSAVGRELLLRKSLAPVRSRYDYILIDPPPSLGLFTLNALVAATEVLIPLQVEIFALQGMGRLQKTIDLVHDLNPALHIGGVLCTMVDHRTSLSTGIEAQARELFGDIVYKTVIPQNVRLAESPGMGQTIFEYDPSSNGARAYIALAEEVARGKEV